MMRNRPQVVHSHGGCFEWSAEWKRFRHVCEVEWHVGGRIRQIWEAAREKT